MADRNGHTAAFAEPRLRRSVSPVMRLVLGIGHPRVIADMRQARERRDGFAA
jgi:hypothetical protein